MRILALSSVDILLSLPVGLISFYLNMVQKRSIPFWPGWKTIHDNWEPETISFQSWRACSWERFIVHWHEWLCVVYAIAIFALFGVSHDARGVYKKAFGRARAGLLRLGGQSSDDTTSVAVTTKDNQ